MTSPSSMNQDLQTGSVASTPPPPAFAPAEIGPSLRIPVLLLLASAGMWLVVASVFALIASIKFHSPYFLADISWLTYGRVRPAWFDSLVYGFCLQAGLAAALWLFARLGERKLVGGLVAAIGAAFWNVGLTFGIGGILAGDSTGFDTLEIPRYAAAFLFIGWVLIAIPALLTFHYRVHRSVYASLWFVVAALFWFPWIYSTACLLLMVYPVRGVAQAVIDWWYAQNLVQVCLGMLGLGTAFYLVPKLTSRPLHSRYLALFSFWVLILFTSWGGVPGSAPVPAWMPTVSRIADLLSVLLLIGVALNIFHTRWGRATSVETAQGRPIPGGSPSEVSSPVSSTPLAFVLVGIACFVVAGLMRISTSWLDPEQQLQFTWFVHAALVLQVYGFFAFIMFGMAYYLLPQVTHAAFSWPKLIRVHFWIAACGLVLLVVPFAVAGVLQAVELSNSTAFLDTVKLTIHFLRMTTVGELLLLLGHVLFVVNIAGILWQLYRAHVLPVYQIATEDLFKLVETKA